MDVPSVSRTIEIQANPRNQAEPPALITSPTIVDQQQFDAFYPEDVVIEFRPLNEVDPATLTFNIKQVSDGRILQRNAVFHSGDLIEFGGAGARISGSPVPGDTFLVASSDKKSILATLEDFSQQLINLTDSSVDRQQLSDEIAVTLENLDNSQTRLLEGQSAVGARLNLVDNVRNTNADIKLATQSALSELQDLDYAAAISQLSQETFILEAAQASFARVSGLSLFNYL
jgi:flagellar hook-associated protein 3 FlgL